MSSPIAILSAIILSEMVSAFLSMKLWQKEEFLSMKILISLVLVIPLLGPAMYFFITGGGKVTPALNNTMPRSEYTHMWISIRGLIINETSSKKEKERPERSEEGSQD